MKNNKFKMKPNDYVVKFKYHLKIKVFFWIKTIINTRTYITKNQ